MKFEEGQIVRMIDIYAEETEYRIAQIMEHEDPQLVHFALTKDQVVTISASELARRISSEMPTASLLPPP